MQLLFLTTCIYIIVIIYISAFTDLINVDVDVDDIRLHTQTYPVSEHANNTGHNPLWNEEDRDLHWYTHRVKEAIHIRLHPSSMHSKRRDLHHK